MKIYTADFNANQPTLKQIGVPNYSTFKVGIDVEKNGEKVELTESDVTLVNGGNTISADGVYNGFVTFPLSTGDCGDDKTFTVKCDKGYDWETTLSGSNPVPASIRGNIDSIDYIPQGITLNATDVYKQTGEDSGRIIVGTTAIAEYFYLPAQGKGYFYGTGFQDENYTVNVDNAKLRLGHMFTGAGSYTVDFKVGTSFSANFSLVVNSVKSSVCESDSKFELPIASSTTLGGVKVGSGLSVVANGKVDVTLDNIPTSVLSGTYSDDTEFSFEVYTKQA